VESDLWVDLAIAVFAAAAVSISAWRFGALRASGSVAATVVGTVVLGFAGIGAAMVLVLFFVTSSALSALPPSGERSARGARQVLANGSVAAATAAISGHAAYGAVAFLGATAAATADTWATEIGVRWGKRPRSILTLRPQPAGTSGAVSIAGSVAAICGALAVGTAGSLLLAGVAGRTVAAVTIAGFAGSVLDSLLGAAIQAEYRCPQCGASPEVARHDGCGVRADRVSGVPGLDNDAVNWVATLAGAAAAVMLTAFPY
jgi:uncharacterized protein (TIGR00297 family)